MNNIVIDESYTLKNFVALDTSEISKVLAWRNSDYVRMSMKDESIIDAKAHNEFVSSLKVLKSKLYFLVQYKNRDLGVINFIDIDQDISTLGLYLCPEAQGTGRGIILELIAIKYFFNNFTNKVLLGYVKNSNLNSLELQPFFGFKLSRKDDKYTYFELNYEIWSHKDLNLKNLNKELIKYARKNKKNS